MPRYFGGGAGTTYTGTANQVIVTDTVLSTPQDIATTSSPQFAALGVGGAAGAAGTITATAGITGTTGTFNTGGVVASTSGQAALTMAGSVILYGYSTTTADVRLDLTGAGARWGWGYTSKAFKQSTTSSLAWVNTDTLAGLADANIDTRIRRAGAAGGISIDDNANGKSLDVKMLTELTTIAAAATTDTAIQIPAGAIVLGVSVRVTTVIPTAATFTVIGTTSSTAFNTAAVSTAAGTTDKGTAAGAYYNATAQTVRITPNVQPADNTGRVRVTIYYLDVTPATS